MNVTLKLPDDLCREARHRAVDESKSLSAWVASLIKREIVTKSPDSTQNALEALRLPDAPDWFYEKELPLEERASISNREFTFEAE